MNNNDKEGENQSEDISHGSKKRSESNTQTTHKEQVETKTYTDENNKRRKFVNRTDHVREPDKNGVYPSLLGFAPKLQMLWWEYDMDTVIHNYLDDTKFTVCEYMEGKVDLFGLPVKKEDGTEGKGAGLK